MVAVTRFAPVKIRVRPKANHPCKQQLQVTPEHPCHGEGSALLELLLLRLANIPTPHQAEACCLLANFFSKKEKKKEKTKGKKRKKKNRCFAVVFIVVQFPR